MILGGLWYLGANLHGQRYHRPRWSWQDWLTLIVAVGVMAICVLPMPGIDRKTLYYDPYPTLSLPPFSLLLGMVMLALLIPGLLKKNQGMQDTV